MIQCPNCNSTYLEGTLFCEECGAALDMGLLASDKRTDPLRGDQDFQDTQKHRGTGPVGPAASSDVTPDARRVPSGSFGLWIANSRRRESFEMNGEIVIGRLDSANLVFPDLDLTSDGGFEGGVSRRHSRITFRDGIPYVEDLDSTNHTYLNDMRLEPLTPHSLRHGDELRLGSMLLRVELPQTRDLPWAENEE